MCEQSVKNDMAKAMATTYVCGCTTSYVLLHMYTHVCMNMHLESHPQHVIPCAHTHNGIFIVMSAFVHLYCIEACSQSSLVGLDKLLSQMKDLLFYKCSLFCIKIHFKIKAHCFASKMCLIFEVNILFVELYQTMNNSMYVAIGLVKPPCHLPVYHLHQT